MVGYFVIGIVYNVVVNNNLWLFVFLNSVVYVFCLGGMFNEFNNIILRIIDGVYEGVVIGGDRYFGMIFMDYVMRY